MTLKRGRVPQGTPSTSPPELQLFNDGAWETLPRRSPRRSHPAPRARKAADLREETATGHPHEGIELEVVMLGQDGITDRTCSFHDERNPNPGYAFLCPAWIRRRVPTPLGVLRAVDAQVTRPRSTSDRRRRGQEGKATCPAPPPGRPGKSVVELQSRSRARGSPARLTHEDHTISVGSTTYFVSPSVVRLHVASGVQGPAGEKVLR